MTTEIIHGDSRNVLDLMPSSSIHSIVTDPPYALTAGKKGGSGEASVNLESPYGRARITTGFMGKAWDTGDTAFDPAFWREALRVLKPGGHVLAFGGTRTYHRLAVAIEDAGFEIRDQIGWLYGSGFPKSSNQDGDWQGWGTALKPAWEPIVVARKPLIGTVPVNLVAHGVGALNIDGCRVPFAGEDDEAESKTKNQHADFGSGPMTNQVFGKFDKDRENYDPTGRWPANVIHDGSDDVLGAFPNSNGSGPARTLKRSGGTRAGDWGMNAREGDQVSLRDGGSGSAARFFYCAKASKKDRGEGNTHPTVKPTDLMRYLCRLVTPPGGTVLDPFMGSGSTGRGAVLEGFNFIGCELSDEYVAIARARIASVEPRHEGIFA